MSVLVFGLAGLAGASCRGSSHDGLTQVTASDCASCHLTEYLKATEPPHVGLYPKTCARCHGTKAWNPAKHFDHAQYFPLEGKHTVAACKDCHTKGFKPGDTPKDCVGCHQKDYDSSPFPSHDTFPTTCADCHTTAGWQPATISNHDQFFPIDGKHKDANCASCHTKGYAPGDTPKDCVACHQKDYDNSPFPNHNTFPTTCRDCHTTAGWQQATFPGHETFFKLDGKHTSVGCGDCHKKGYAPGDTPTTCIGCHKMDYDGTQTSTTAPTHAGDAGPPATPGFPIDCTKCHTTAGWVPMNPSHDPYFVLDGAHAMTPKPNCQSCHEVGFAAGDTPSQCVDCHKQDYDNSPFPNHNTFPTTCHDCHSTTAWKPATGGHPESSLPIASGNHKVPCTDCHNTSLGPVAKDNFDCVDCHSGVHLRSALDGKHTQAQNVKVNGVTYSYPAPTDVAPPGFCYDCHPNGRNQF